VPWLIWARRGRVARTLLLRMVVVVALLALATCGGHTDTGPHYVVVTVDPNLPDQDSVRYPPTDEPVPSLPPIGGADADVTDTGIDVQADAPQDTGTLDAAPDACSCWTVIDTTLLLMMPLRCVSAELPCPDGSFGRD
jgi:hypothetical protein